ncbi:MAG: ParB/RepB/Spo0J family partition protein [Burkholderiaceae bacterium]
MRMPWVKSKGEQLDLLDATSFALTDCTATNNVGIEARELDEQQPSTSRDIPASNVFAWQALVVPIDDLQEDLDNPRTEFPEARLDELAEDIRQNGILQPIVVHPADASGRYRIHFGAMRLRAAQRAGLLRVPIAVRAAAADPYAQVAENQKRCPLSPLDLARFIRGRVDTGDSNATIAKRLGMDLTSIAHHLALLELPPELDHVLKTGRCTSPRTLYELSKLHDEQPDRINALVTGEGEITRSAVAALRAASASTSAPNAAFAKRSTSLVEQANAACARLEVLVIRIKKSEPAQAQPELAALRRRVADLADRLA